MVWSVVGAVASLLHRQLSATFQRCRLLPIGNTDIHLLDSITGNSQFASCIAVISLPVAQLVQNAFDFVGLV